MKPLFTESQRFNQWWAWVIIIFACGFPFVGIYYQLILGKSFGDNPMSNNGLVIFAICSLLFVFMFYKMQLKTEITHENLSFRFIPFINRTISLSEISSMEVINYGFVGGWGIRFATKYGTVYNIKGNKGLYVHLKDGKTFIIGTQKPEQLAKIVEQLK